MYGTALDADHPGNFLKNKIVLESNIFYVQGIDQNSKLSRGLA